MPLFNLEFVFADRPSAPSNLKIDELDRDSVSLSWDASTSDGGSPITAYVIEKRDASRTMWTGTGSVTPDKTTFLATRLFEGSEYFFRVAAENAVGTSDFVEIAKPVIPALPFSM